MGSLMGESPRESYEWTSLEGFIDMTTGLCENTRAERQIRLLEIHPEDI